MYHSIETEQSLIGALITNNKPMLVIPVTEADFVSELHREIFAQMRRIYAEKQSFCLADLEAWAAGKSMDGHEIKDYLYDLANGVIPVSVSMESWAEDLRELSRKRAIEQALNRARLDMPNCTSSQLIAALQSSLTDKLDSRQQRTGEEVHADILQDLELPPVRYSTGLKALNIAMAGGLYAGFTYGICGKEKQGKTTLAHSISYNLAHSGTPHAYFALEMGRKQIEQRNLARTMGINSLEFLNASDALKERLRLAKKTPNVIYVDAPGATLEEILYEVGIMRIKHKITGFVIDYWQLVGGQGDRETEEKHLRYTAQGFADYARKHGLWCIILAQMNAEGNLFGGGGLRKACDQLYFMETPTGSPDLRWLRMGASRYTPQQDVGSEAQPKFYLDKHKGPHFADIQGST